MPDVRYDRAAQSYRARIRCSACRHEEEGPAETWQEAASRLANPGFGHNRFGFSPTRLAYRGRCRECDRRASTESRARRVARGGGSAPGRAGGSWVAPLLRRFGVEIELTYPRTVGRHAIDSALAAAGLHRWRCKTDCSITGNGWEVVSPILQGEDGYEQVRTACRVVQALGGTAHFSAGLHVHHEVRDLGAAGIKRLVRSYTDNCDFIDMMLAPSRRNGGRSIYCARWGTSELARLEDPTRAINAISSAQSQRYKNLNLHCYPRFGTIENRQHQSTTNPTKVVAWIKMMQGLIEAVKHECLPNQHTAAGFLAKVNLDEDTETYLNGRATMLLRERTGEV